MVREFFAPIVVLVAVTTAAGAQNSPSDDFPPQIGLPAALTAYWSAPLPDFLQAGLIPAEPPAFLIAQPEPETWPVAQNEPQAFLPPEQWTATPPAFLQAGLIPAEPPAFLIAQPEPETRPVAQNEPQAFLPPEQWDATLPAFLQAGLIPAEPPGFLTAPPEPEPQLAAIVETPAISPVEQWRAAPPAFLQGGLIPAEPPAFLMAPTNNATTLQSSTGPCAGGGSLAQPAGRFHFYAGSARLDHTARRAISDIVVQLKQCPDLLVEVGGHADNVGDPETNMALAKRRATAIIAALETQGIVGRRLYWRSYGSSNPIAANDTREGRALNRRIDVVLR